VVLGAAPAVRLRRARPSAAPRHPSTQHQHQRRRRQEAPPRAPGPPWCAAGREPVCAAGVPRVLLRVAQGYHTASWLCVRGWGAGGRGDWGWAFLRRRGREAAGKMARRVLETEAGSYSFSRHWGQGRAGWWGGGREGGEERTAEEGKAEARRVAALYRKGARGSRLGSSWRC